MCLFNINSTINVYKIISDTSVDYSSKLFSIQSLVENGKKFIKDFAIVVDMNLLASENEERAKLNVINENGVLKCELRIVIGDGSNNTLVMNVDTFDLDFSTESELKVEEARGKKFCNFSRTVLVRNIELPPNKDAGIFNIELIVKREIDGEIVDTNGDIIQSVYNISVI